MVSVYYTKLWDENVEKLTFWSSFSLPVLTRPSSSRITSPALLESTAYVRKSISRRYKVIINKYWDRPERYLDIFVFCVRMLYYFAMEDLAGEFIDCFDFISSLDLNSSLVYAIQFDKDYDYNNILQNVYQDDPDYNLDFYMGCPDKEQEIVFASYHFEDSEDDNNEMENPWDDMSDEEFDRSIYCCDDNED